MQTKTAFAPMLTIGSGVTNIDFYKKAFNAVERQRWSNDDGSIHVVEFTIDDAMFHLHEKMSHSKAINPLVADGTTVIIGLFVNDPYAIEALAVSAGAIVISPVQDYDYGYRQGELQDPFGHIWQIQKVI